MPGHVNMMDDVLISQLPPLVLRSALRALISQGKASQLVLVNHVSNWLRNSPPPFTPHAELFDTTRPAYSEYLSTVRCMFTTVEMASESLPYFSHFLSCIPQAHLHWAHNCKIELTLVEFGADIVQAVQALKETRPPRTEQLENRLLDLQRALASCAKYIEENGLSSPFIRAQRQVHDVLSFFFPTIHGAPEPVDVLEFQFKQWANIHVTNILEEVDIIERVDLGSLRVPRLFNGLWQLSSPAWGSTRHSTQLSALERLLKRQLSAADMADHYGDAELIYAAFRRSLPSSVASTVIAATKWCIFRQSEEELSTDFVLNGVKERCKRLGGRIDLLQFHWQDYSNKDYLKVLLELVRITKSHPELVSNIGLCNFDAEHTEEACAYLLSEEKEVRLVSNQIQYSLVDSRPTVKVVNVSLKYGLKLLTYGSLCGGFIADKWLNAERPNPYCKSLQLTPSQRKYLDMIQTWGSWDDFQALLSMLQKIAHKHHVDIANVATRWVLDRPAVAATIIGTRLGVSDNSESNIQVFSLKLDQEDTDNLNELALLRVGRVYDQLGDCGNEYHRNDDRK